MDYLHKTLAAAPDGVVSGIFQTVRSTCGRFHWCCLVLSSGLASINLLYWSLVLLLAVSSHRVLVCLCRCSFNYGKSQRKVWTCRRLVQAAVQNCVWAAVAVEHRCVNSVFQLIAANWIHIKVVANCLLPETIICSKKGVLMLAC